MKLPDLTTALWGLNSINKTVAFVYIIIMTLIKSFFLAIAIMFVNKAQAQLPPGFDYTLFSDQVPGVTTLEFAENGNIYACDFSGKIWVFIDNELQPEPIIDISDEVAGYGELGCLSFALHPDFILNGYIYLLYVVDRHHLANFGTENYDPQANQFYEATQGRVSRFQVQLNDYQTLIPNSRTVLFGENFGDGNPALTTSHGAGDMLFGTDKSLIFTTGDGNTWENNFAGGDDDVPSTAFDTQALEDGIISEAENVGAFRAQQIQSYSGKVLRIDPMTGEGLPGNPFYDESNPDAPQSKVWALGLRNPYRIALRPGTGSENPEDGNPGTLYITDVGASSWEEINVCDGPGYNFGWPLYEGLSQNNGYFNKIRQNLFEHNPLASGACSEEFFTFQQLIQQENGLHEYFFPNPCNTSENIAESNHTFYHTRPSLAYRNNSWNPAGNAPMLPVFDENNNATGLPITQSEANVIQAEDFGGIAAMTGDFYDGNAFPEDYIGMLPVLDYSGWLKTFWFDENHVLTKMEHWLDGLQNVIDVRYNPQDQCYYTLTLWPSEIRRICFTGNLQPVVQATATPSYGTSPLTVVFDATETYDPEGDPLTFEWDFGDGTNSTANEVTHEYFAPDQNPYSLTATLTVSDTAGNLVERNFLISLNNSPPQVEISGITDGQLYAMQSPSLLPLEADVTDEEHSISELTFMWNTYLHHNSHFHPLTQSSDETSSFIVNPVGCEEFDSYFYRISLLVTDPEGLSGYDELFIYPDCDGVLSSLSENEINIFPNPASGWISVNLNSPVEQSLDLQVYSANGALVLNVSIAKSGQKVIDISRLAPGIYTLRVIVHDENRVLHKRFLLQH